MAANLINQLQSEFSDDVVSKLASYLGETPARTQSALGYAIPAVLGGLFQKAQTPQGASDLFGTLQRSGFDGRSLGSISSILRSSAGPTELIKAGSNLLSSLFGTRQTNVTESIGATSGLGKQSATSLLALAASYVAGIVGKEATAAGGFNASSIANLLGGQGPYLAAVAPGGLGQILGVSSWEHVEPARRYEAVQAPPAKPYERDEPGGGLGWLRWVLPLLLLALSFWAWRGLRPEEAGRTVDRVTSSAARPLRSVAAAVPLVKRRLTCGQEIDVARDGVESKLINFIDDKSRPVNDATWFTFDRLEFETASATLKPDSQPQLRNIAAIMNCYPNVGLKVGGYTDNTGDPAANLKLSQARAENTRAAIVGHNIPASRLEAEGYGEQHPVATNNTEEGRQRNRRIDVRVTRK